MAACRRISSLPPHFPVAPSSIDSQAWGSLSLGMRNQKSSGAVCSLSAMLTPNHRALGGRKPVGSCSHLGGCTPGPPTVLPQNAMGSHLETFQWAVGCPAPALSYSAHVQALLRCLCCMCRSRTSLCVFMHCSDLSLPTQSPREGSEMGRGERVLVALPPPRSLTTSLQQPQMYICNVLCSLYVGACVFTYECV